MYLHIYTHIHRYMYTYVYIYMYMSICIYIIYISIYIYIFIYICKSTLFSYVCTWLHMYFQINCKRERESRDKKREKHVQFENAPPKMRCDPQQPSAPASLVSLVSQDVDAIAAITGAVEVAVTVVLPQCCSGIQPPWHLLLGVSRCHPPSLASKPSVRDKASLISDH